MQTMKEHKNSTPNVYIALQTFELNRKKNRIIKKSKAGDHDLNALSPRKENKMFLRED